MEEPPDTGVPEGLEPVFLTLKLAQARLAERVLTDAGVDYAVNVEVLGRTLIGFRRNGVVFYVAPEDRSRCVTLLTNAGLASGLMPVAQAPDR